MHPQSQVAESGDGVHQAHEYQAGPFRRYHVDVVAGDREIVPVRKFLTN